MGAGSAERDVDSMPYGHKPDLRRTGRRIEKACQSLPFFSISPSSLTFLFFELTGDITATRNPQSPVDRSGGPVRRSSRLQRGLPTVSPQITDKRRGIGVPPTQKKKELRHSHSRKGNKKQGTTSPPPPPKILKQNPPKHTKETVTCSRRDQYIEHWLNDTQNPRKSLTSLHDTVVNISHGVPAASPTNRPSANPCGTTTSTQEASGTMTPSSGNPEELALFFRSIFIDEVQPPLELERRAKQLISGVPDSGDVDLATLETLRRVLISSQGESESKLTWELFPLLNPGQRFGPNLRVEPNQLWSNCVPIPSSLDESEASDLPPISKPKPDITFGFSIKAFTVNQQYTLLSTCDDDDDDDDDDDEGEKKKKKKKPMRNYAMPDGKTVFPFLIVELKSEGNSGTHFVAKKQAANSGAIALNGNLYLLERGLGLGSFDHEEPHHFSITVTFTSAYVNLHWVELVPPAEGREHQYRFHVTTLELYPLFAVDGLLALFRAVRNILEWGVNTRLPKLSAALDACHSESSLPEGSMERATPVK